jgi:hypothetical protein
MDFGCMNGKKLICLLMTLALLTLLACSSPDTTETSEITIVTPSPGIVSISELPAKYSPLFAETDGNHTFDFQYIFNHFNYFSISDGLLGPEKKQYQSKDLEGVASVFSNITLRDPYITDKIGYHWFIEIHEKDKDDSTGISITIFTEVTYLTIAIRDNDKLVMGLTFDVPKDKIATLDEALQRGWDKK